MTGAGGGGNFVATEADDFGSDSALPVLDLPMFAVAPLEARFCPKRLDRMLMDCG